MTHPLLEKKLAEFDEKFGALLGGSEELFAEVLKDFLTTALEEALLAGIEMAEGVVDALHVGGPTRKDEEEMYVIKLRILHETKEELKHHLATLKESVGKV